MNNEKILTHIDLFSGIGGFSLAAEWAGFRTVVFCEKEEFCQKVLKKHWPEIPIIQKIQDFEGKKWRDATILTGGFPCQPFSVAGKRRGKEDDRYLWPEMLRVINQAKPNWVLGENVPGIFRMALDEVLADLESENYSTTTLIIPACGLNAPHRRNRIWIMAHRKSRGIQGRSIPIRPRQSRKATCNTIRSSKIMANPFLQRLSLSTQEEFKSFQCQEKPSSRSKFNRTVTTQWDSWSVEPDVGRVAYGIPSRVDRIKALGNAIVPQIAYEILKNIAWIEKLPTK